MGRLESTWVMVGFSVLRYPPESLNGIGVLLPGDGKGRGCVGIAWRLEAKDGKHGGELGWGNG